MASPGAHHGCRSCQQPLASHRVTHGFVLFFSWQQQPRLWWLRSGMDISHEHGGSAASSQVMEDWNNSEHPPGTWPLLRLAWTFGLHLKHFIFPLQRSLGALMESVFSSLPDSPLATQGMVRQPRAAWAWLPAGRAVGRSSTGARPLPCQVTGPGGSRAVIAASGTKRWGRGWGHTGWCGHIFRFISLPLSRHSQARWGKGYGSPHSDMG